MREHIFFAFCLPLLAGTSKSSKHCAKPIIKRRRVSLLAWRPSQKGHLKTVSASSIGSINLWPTQRWEGFNDH